MTEEDALRESPRAPLPRIALAMGDPAGIGPEIVIKALQDERVFEACSPTVIGDAGVMRRAPGWGADGPRLQAVSSLMEVPPQLGRIAIMDLDNVPKGLAVGVATATGGRSSMDYLRQALELALAGEADAVVFAPLNKEAMKMAGLPHHDEYGYFAELCAVAEGDYTVLMVGPHFSLASVTLHIPLGEVASYVTAERVLATIRRGHTAAVAAGIAVPRIGVAGLNPHAGENGTIGTEERDAIRPAVEAARGEGIDAYGPFPPDTFFMTAKENLYDVYVGMYHDQGRIALKMLDFGRATTMAEGLPVTICTVGHGSAYDIAGKGVANHENLVQTLLLAARRAANPPAAGTASP